MRPVTERRGKVTWVVPLACRFTAGTGWQAAQAMGEDSAGARAPFTWARWAPTRAAEARVPPVVSMGGAAAWFASAPATPARPVVPWQLVQLSVPVRVTTPSTCVAAATVVVE